MAPYKIETNICLENGKEKEITLFLDEGLISFEKKDNVHYVSIKEKDTIVIPGFIDTHIHGCGGYGTEDSKKESILNMSASLLSSGVTSFFPTLYTDKLERILSDERAIIEAIGKEDGAEIKGIHIEGPFISPSKIGAQNPLGRLDPDKTVLNKILKEGKNKIKAMTLAPELKGSLELISILLENNIIPLQGHTDANKEESTIALNKGAKHFTHLFNAMSPLKHREPGVPGVALSNLNTTVEIIADGLHVDPSVFLLSYRAVGKERIIVITDSLKPTLQKDGETLANGVPVVLKDGLWVTKGNEDLIQGSSLTMHQAFKNLISWGIPIFDAVKMTSTNAATLYSLSDRGEIKEGKRADILLLDKKDFSIKHIFIKGEKKCGMTI